MSAGGLSSAATESESAGGLLVQRAGVPGGWPSLPRSGGRLAGLQNHPQYRLGRARDAESALWDRLIERVTENYLALTLEAGNELAMAQFERVMRVLASEHRFSRRVLSIAIRERAIRARDARIGSILPSSFNPGVVYVLLTADHDMREP